jgi:hypothetical protein
VHSSPSYVLERVALEPSNIKEGKEKNKKKKIKKKR